MSRLAPSNYCLFTVQQNRSSRADSETEITKLLRQFQVLSQFEALPRLRKKIIIRQPCAEQRACMFGNSVLRSYAKNLPIR